ncbi:U-box domain-containing protein 9 [Bienertia sinuspersici]
MEIIEKEDEDDDSIECENGVILGTTDKTIQALTALKKLKLMKKKKSLTSKFDELNVPDEFRCPISSQIMKDSVILSTGQTYQCIFFNT